MCDVQSQELARPQPHAPQVTQITVARDNLASRGDCIELRASEGGGGAGGDQSDERPLRLALHLEDDGSGRACASLARRVHLRDRGALRIGGLDHYGAVLHQHFEPVAHFLDLGLHLGGRVLATNHVVVRRRFVLEAEASARIRRQTREEHAAGSVRVVLVLTVAGRAFRAAMVVTALHWRRGCWRIGRRRRRRQRRRSRRRWRRPRWVRREGRASSTAARLALLIRARRVMLGLAHARLLANKVGRVGRKLRRAFVEPPRTACSVQIHKVGVGILGLAGGARPVVKGCGARGTAGEVRADMAWQGRDCGNLRVWGLTVRVVDDGEEPNTERRLAHL